MTYRIKQSFALVTTILIFCLICVFSCKSKHAEAEKTIVVSIAPLKYIVETITCGDFNIDVLLPEGSSPETYSPTPKQIAGIENAEFLFTTGLLDFENEVVTKLGKSLTLSPDKVVSLSKGVALLDGSCSHSHEGHKHSHGVDPHIWTSPEQLKIIALNAYEAINNAYPDSVKYTIAYKKFNEEIETLSTWVKSTVGKSGVEKFIIYHPALAYYANDYGLKQIAIENEGKEPSATHMKGVINDAKGSGIRKVMYQREFSRSVVEPIARELNAEIVEINPLSEDIMSEIKYITNVITSND